MDAFGNTVLSGTSTRLLDQLKAKEITLEEFLRECAYWALKDGFDELIPHPLPTAPRTEAFKEYEALPPERKIKVEPIFFRNNPEILDYYGQVFSINWRNKYALDWLEEIKGYLSQEDEISIRRIDDRILEFRAFFDDSPILVQRIKSTFQAKEVKPHKKPYYSIGEIINPA